MFRRSEFLGTALVAALWVNTAQAAVIDLEPTSDFFDSISQGGYTFTSSQPAGSNSLGNWALCTINNTCFNSNFDAGTNTVFTNHPVKVTVTADDGKPFDFLSIGLADVYNAGTGGYIEFNFNYADGTTTPFDFLLTAGVKGLQTFTAAQTGLLSFDFFGLTTDRHFMQFDTVNLSQNTTAVPGPIAGGGLPVLAAFGGFVLWRRRKPAPAA